MPDSSSNLRSLCKGSRSSCRKPQTADVPRKDPHRPANDQNKTLRHCQALSEPPWHQSDWQNKPFADISFWPTAVPWFPALNLPSTPIAPGPAPGSSPNTADPSASKSSGTSAALVGGLVAAGVALVLIAAVVCCVWCGCRKRRAKLAAKDPEGSPDGKHFAPVSSWPGDGEWRRSAQAGGKLLLGPFSPIEVCPREETPGGPDGKHFAPVSSWPGDGERRQSAHVDGFHGGVLLLELVLSFEDCPRK